MIGIDPSAGSWMTPEGANVTAPLGAGGSSGFGYAGPIMAVFGALQAGIGSYFSAQSTKDQLKFQANMAAINARMAENTAQSILDAGQKQAATVSSKYGQVKSAQKVSQASRGVQGGEGSAAEEIASTDLMKETDMLTIDANAVRAAWAARTQATNSANEALLKNTSADSISPFSSAATSLIGSATSVANTWYSHKRMDDLFSARGGSF